MREVVPHERIEKRIYEIRGKKVMLDADLAELYAVQTRALNQAVARNNERFPVDFVFLKSVTSCDPGSSLLVTHLCRLNSNNLSTLSCQ